MSLDLMIWWVACRTRLALGGFEQMMRRPTDRLIGISNLELDVVTSAKHEDKSPRNAQIAIQVVDRILESKRPSD